MTRSQHTAQHDRDRSTSDAPTSLLQFVRRFPTDETCADFLFKLRYPDGYACPKCGSRKAWPAGLLRTMKCTNDHIVSITAGTTMHRSKQPLTVWFYAAYLVSTLTPGISALQFQKQLGLTRYETAFQMLHKLRSALVAPGRERLRGEVEIDEGFVGGTEKGRPGRGADRKALVVIAVEIVRYDVPDPNHPKDPDAAIEKVRAGRVRMTVIPDAKAATLIPWVQANVEEGAVVSTDGWAGYVGLSKLGYDHRRVLQSHEGKATGRYLPMVHLLISNLKRWLLGTHKGAVRRKHLQAYLNEFTFRFNRRFWRGPAFVRALGLAVNAEKWPEYASLYGGEWAHPNPRQDELPALTVEALYESLREEADATLRTWMGRNKAAVRREIRQALQAAGYTVVEA